jgi:hypothetical protein
MVGIVSRNQATRQIRELKQRMFFPKKAQKTLRSGLELSSHPIARALLSPLRRFKTLFEKGRVGSTSLKRPERNVFIA